MKTNVNHNQTLTTRGNTHRKYIFLVKVDIYFTNEQKKPRAIETMTDKAFWAG